MRKHTRRRHATVRIVRWAGLAAITLLLAAGTAAAARPNFLVIVVDDQSPMALRIYNPRSVLQTPNIDRLAREGMVIDQAHHMGAWVGAVCTPSRHMIMTGRTVWHIPGPGRQNRNPHSGNPRLVPPDLAQYSLPAVFNRAGYVTMRTCKRGNSYPAANRLFQVRHEATKRGPTDETGSAWHAQRVLDFLDQWQADKQRRPFLIYLGFSHPHDPRYGKPELLKKYGATNHRDPKRVPKPGAGAPPLPISYLPAHPFHHGHPNLRDEVAVEGVWRRRDPDTVRNELGRECACSENIDIQIGRVLRKLEQLGQLENTYIIYTSDHGIAVGRHGLMGKQNLYEHTFRVPMIVRGPGIRPGSRAQGMIYLLDLLPTLCDLAGIEPPRTVEGRSFRPVLEGRRQRVRDVVYGVYCGGTLPGIRCVKTFDGWKLIKYDVLQGRVRKTQLFNLRENPHELLRQHQDPAVCRLTGNRPQPRQVNLADDPNYRKKRQELERLLLEQMTRLDDPYRLWDQPPLKRSGK